MVIRRRVHRIRRRPKRFTRGMRQTLFLFLVFVFLLFLALGIRIYTLNRDNGDAYKKQVFSQQSYTNKVLSFRRGAIKDRNGTILAQSVRKFNLILEPRTILADAEVKAETLAKIAQYFAFDTSNIEKILAERPKSMYQHVDGLKELTRKQISEFQEEMKKNKKIQGVWFEEIFTREYPLDTIGANVIGFTSSENQGTYGVEGSYNDKLNGKNGREYGYFDANMDFQRTVKKAVNGNSVVLTLDANVQRLSLIHI